MVYVLLHDAGSESDWVLDLVAVGFDKPLGQLEGTMRSSADVAAASDAFCSAYCQVGVAWQILGV